MCTYAQQPVCMATLRNHETNRLRDNMTSVQPTSETSTGTDLVGWEGGETGLEEFSQSDMSMPRLLIDHQTGVFKDSQTEETFEALQVILLGLHKGRIMWQDINESDDGDAPLCKSPDFANGFPELDPDLSKSKRFPFGSQTVFDITDAKPIKTAEGPTRPALPCSECRFKEWNSDPSGRKPWCSEEWTLPMLYRDPNAPEDEPWSPALFTVRRSGLKPAKSYISPFASKKIPLFTVVTSLSLDIVTRGRNQYCTPKFAKAGKTERESWDDFMETFQGARAYLSMFPMPKTDDTDDDLPEDNGIIEGNVVDEAPEPARKSEPEPEPEPEEVPVEERTIKVGSVRKPEPKKEATEAPRSGGTVVIDPDEEPPF